MDLTRKIIDYAQNDQGSEMRDALYSAIHDKVMAHIETKKQDIAQSLLAQPEDSSVENT
jgi:hypothetical protein